VACPGRGGRGRRAPVSATSSSRAGARLARPGADGGGGGLCGLGLLAAAPHPAGHHFVLRVGATVRLVRQLGWTRAHAQGVYLWPDQAAQKRQPPLVLRLVVSSMTGSTRCI
jgi:hypothetical protein